MRGSLDMLWGRCCPVTIATHGQLHAMPAVVLLGCLGCFEHLAVTGFLDMLSAHASWTCYVEMHTGCSHLVPHQLELLPNICVVMPYWCFPSDLALCTCCSRVSMLCNLSMYSLGLLRFLCHMRQVVQVAHAQWHGCSQGAAIGKQRPKVRLLMCSQPGLCCCRRPTMPSHMHCPQCSATLWRWQVSTWTVQLPLPHRCAPLPGTCITARSLHSFRRKVLQ